MADKLLLTDIKKALALAEYDGGLVILDNEDEIIKSILSKAEKHYVKLIADGWELYETLMDLTVLNQNAPKIVLTNDECGWSITHCPDPPYTTGEISIMKGNPLEAVRSLRQALKGEQ